MVKKCREGLFQRSVRTESESSPCEEQRASSAKSEAQTPSHPRAPPAGQAYCQVPSVTFLVYDAITRGPAGGENSLPLLTRTFLTRMP